MAENKTSSKSKWILIAIIVVLVLLLASAAGWWFLLRPSAAPTPQQIAKEREANVKFIDLGSLVTNLQSSDGSTHYIQVEVQLKTYDPSIEAKVKALMPEIRNNILLLLAAQHADQVGEPQVRTDLLKEIKTRVNAILDSDGGTLSAKQSGDKQPIAAVYFSSFVIQ
ncbi:MAG: flagellar basal body-associated FliL family protein [Acidithiobacillus sp.]|uniref:flagellar basal body-associated FliL family protein n=1 Tax=Acidithiobacillus sp. TaxID=1872118 RepID=UPI003CFE352E